MLGLKELIELKKIQIKHNDNCIRQDLMVFVKPSPQQERLQRLLHDSRVRKDKRLREELDVLQTADDALCSILMMIDANTTKHDNTIFNKIWNIANKPYAVQSGSKKNGE